MLKSIDILIGLSVIMLVVSMAVTLITQAITNLLQSRGRHLRRGITDLLEQLHPGMTQAFASSIAEMVLMHPLIRVSQRQLGTVVHREELTKLLMQLAAHPEPTTGNSSFRDPSSPAVTGSLKERALEALRKLLRESGIEGPAKTSGSLKEKILEVLRKLLRENGIEDPAKEKGPLREKSLEVLRKLLKENGIEDPAKTLENVRALALQLEKSNPELANNVRQNLAILHEASSQFVAKMNAGFDPIIDRVAERFTFSTRIVTFFSALLVAVALQLDTVSLVNRLAMDDTLRSALVQQALASQANGSQQDPGSNPGAAKSKEYSALLAKTGLISLPSNLGDWRTHWAEVNLSGVVISTLLLSLGAPFWYNALSNLLRLRSVLAKKDDEQRSERQSFQAPVNTPAGPASAAPPALVGERGDPVAVG
jgi:hypothetical protein